MNFSNKMRFVTVVLAYFGLWKLDVRELHSEVMTGKLSEASLYKLLHVGQIKEFVAYHELVKKLYNLLTEEGSKDRNAVEELIAANPQLEGWILLHSRGLLSPEGKRRLYFGLTQIGGIIERDLEKSINHRNKKRNVIRREN